MTHVHANKNGRKEKNGLAPVIDLADFKTKTCLEQCAVYVGDLLRPKKNMMLRNWNEFSPVGKTPCRHMLFSLRDYIPKWWATETLWNVFIVTVVVEVLKGVRSQKNYVPSQPMDK